jgi:type I restriction enzyme, R subunit
MTFNPDSEDTLERNAVRLFEELGWKSANCYHEVCGTNATLGRETTDQVVLESRLKAALEHLNPGVPPLALGIAADEVTKDRSVLSPVRSNQEVYKLLKDGVKVTYRAADDN